MKQLLGTKREQPENLVVGSDSTLQSNTEQEHNLEGLFARDPFLGCVEVIESKESATIRFIVVLEIKTINKTGNDCKVGI